MPADARLLEGDPVEVDQSALTGESLPVTRKTGEAVFSGSIIRQGEIDAMVMPPARTPISARRHNWCRRRIPLAIFNAQC